MLAACHSLSTLLFRNGNSIDLPLMVNVPADKPLGIVGFTVRLSTADDVLLLRDALDTSRRKNIN